MVAYTPKHPVKTGQPRKNSEFKIQNLEMFWAAERAIRYKPREARGLFASIPAANQYKRTQSDYKCNWKIVLAWIAILIPLSTQISKPYEKTTIPPAFAGAA